MNPFRLWFTGAGWRVLWVALRRSGRDDLHAQQNLLRLLAPCIPFFLYIAWCAFFIHGAVTDLGWNVVLVMLVGGSISAFFAIIFIVRQKLEERAYDKANPAVAVKLKLSLYRESCLLATLLERLASEVAMEKELPPEITVITRRVLLDRLTSLNLREGLEPWLLDILLAPDGHWPANLKLRASYGWECLSVLRWALGVANLPGPTADPKYTIADARSLLTIAHPEKCVVLPAWDIRPARDATSKFFNRCWSELTARRQLVGVQEKDVARALEARAAIQEKGYTADYVIGTRTISELNNDFLWQIMLRAYNRWQTLLLLVDVMCEEKPPIELRTLYAGFFASAEPQLAPPRSLSPLSPSVPQ